MRQSFRALFNGTNATAPSLPLVNLYQVQSVIVGRVPLQVGAVVEVAAAVVVVVVVVDDEAVSSKETVNKTFQLKHRVVQHSNVNLE